MENVIHVAMLLFIDNIDAATTMLESCGSDGSSPESGWSKKVRDINDKLYCGQFAWELSWMVLVIIQLLLSRIKFQIFNLHR